MTDGNEMEANGTAEPIEGLEEVPRGNEEVEEEITEEDKIRIFNLKAKKIKHKKAVRALLEACYFNSLREVKTTIANNEPVEEWINKEAPKDEICDPKEWTAPQSTCLCIACRYASLEIVMLLVRLGAKVDIANSYGNNPLHRACRSKIDSLEKVIFLLNLDSKLVDTKNRGKRMPLHVATQYATLEVVRELVARGAPLFKRDSYGDLPVHKAARSDYDQFEKLDFLLTKDIRQINIGTRQNRTLLHEAAATFPIDRVKWLVETGSDPKKFDCYSDTSLHVAVRSKKDALEKVEYLMSKDSDLVHVQNKVGSSSLHVACQEGTFDIVKHLVSKGGDLNLKNEDDDMALHKACISEIDREEKVAYIVQNESHQIHTRNRFDNMPIHLSTWFGYNDAIIVLINWKAGVDEKGNMERTPLHMAAERGHQHTVELLLSHKADINAKNESGMTPLHFASNCGKLDCVTFLIDNEADVNSIDNTGNTPLHHASYSNELDAVKELAYSDEINIRMKNSRGNMALHYAENDPDYNAVEVEQKHISELGSVFSVLRKLDIDYKKAEAVAKSVDFHMTRLTRDLYAEDHVPYLYERCILTRKEKRNLDAMVSSENKARTLLHILIDKDDVYWAPFFMESLKRVPRATSLAVMVDGTSQQRGFYVP